MKIFIFYGDFNVMSLNILAQFLYFAIYLRLDG